MSGTALMSIGKFVSTSAGVRPVAVVARPTPGSVSIKYSTRSMLSVPGAGGTVTTKKLRKWVCVHWFKSLRLRMNSV